MTHKLVIDGNLPSLNEYINASRAHPQKGAKVKMKAGEIVKLEIIRQMRGTAIFRPVYMRYKWIEPKRNRDKDNISGMGRKIIQDALVEVGVLAGDGWKHITGFSDDFEVDRKNPRIEVEIIEIE